MTFDKFKNDIKTIDAVTRNIEIIGEAAKNIPSEIRLKHFGVDESILWQTITVDLPKLKKQIKQIDI